MIELNPDKLKNPLQAGFVGGLIYLVFNMIRDRLKRQSDQIKPLSEYLRPSLVVGSICAIVMHMSNGPNKRTLTEPFEQSLQQAAPTAPPMY